MQDILIPIVFPDYRISVDVPKWEFDLFPDVNFDNFTIPRYSTKFSNLGHAGVLFISGETGLTKYYEYGRYDPPTYRGFVRKIKNLPDINIVDGQLDFLSLKKVLRKISKSSGNSGRVRGVFLEIDNKFEVILKYARRRQQQNSFPKRRHYDLFSNSCIHFVKDIAQIAGVNTPWMIDPRPNSYIGEFRDDFADLDYSMQKDQLVIEGMGKY